MALAVVINQFKFNGCIFVEYLCRSAGDELPLHSHSFNHLTKVTNGAIEVFTDDGVSLSGKAGDEPFEYTAGRMHGIRSLTDGAMFLNISPDVAA